MATREDFLSRLRETQQRPAIETAGATDRRSLRIILEFSDPPDPAAVAAAIRDDLAVEVSVGRLSEEHGLPGGDEADGLARFLAVTIPGVGREASAESAFELGHALADTTGAETAEPELGTDFFVVPREDETGLEGLDGSPLGCWVDPRQDPTAQQPHWAIEKIGARAAWQLTPPAGGKSQGEGISVFQPDTGVADHQEIEAGMLDLARAFDFIANAPGATDPLDYSGNPGHGTGTASVVASRIAGRMAGAAPLTTLVPLRAVEKVVVFDHGRVAAAVEHARRNGAHVITMSLGGPWSSALRAAIGRAIDDGVVVMAAAGNCVKQVVWPARYEEVIAVAATNSQDRPWIGSCRGGAVDVSAPGEFVPRANRAAQNGGSPEDVRGGQGTSFAVALTAGVAALWLAFVGPDAVRRSLGPKETVQGRFARLLRTTSRCPPGFDTGRYGAGIVDAEQLLRHASAPVLELEAFDAPAEMESSLQSLRSLLVERPVAASPAGLEALAPATVLPDRELRRYAAELAHLALHECLRAQPGDGTEMAPGQITPSPSLRQVLELAQPGSQ